MISNKPTSINEYIAGFPKEVQAVLQQVRTTIQQAVPDAEEAISYGIPTFNRNGTYLVYFAGYKKHISLYPTPAADNKLQEDIASFRAGKGTLQFPLNKPIPLPLIVRVVEQLLKDNKERTDLKN